MVEIADFKMFLVVWNRRQNMETPRLHLRMAGWLEARWCAGDTRMVLMAFRSAGKSTLVGLFAAWLLYRDPALRILVLAADGGLAGKMVRNVKRIIERHPLTRHLKPRAADQWASDRFTVNRDTEYRDPSMVARGVTGNITGSRADIVICDDVEVPNTCDSADKREDLRLRLGEVPYVLVAGGVQLYVGTPHDYYSIYADVARTEIGEDVPFLDGFSRLSIPVEDGAGNSAWPERYSPEIIAQIKQATGANKFDSQMMLRFVNILEGRLNPDLLHFYNAPVEYARELNTLYIGQNKMAGVRCWWDPAFGSAKGDDSVLAVVFADEAGNYYLHHLEYIKVDKASDVDEAKQQCKIVAEVARRFYVSSIVIEINGLGKLLPGILKNEATLAKVPLAVQGISNTKAKAVRILEEFDTVMASGRLFVHEDIRKTPFLMEMREWRPEGRGSKGSDDALDAVAGALSQHPDRLARAFGNNGGGQSWMTGGKTQQGKDGFDV